MFGHIGFQSALCPAITCFRGLGTHRFVRRGAIRFPHFGTTPLRRARPKKERLDSTLRWPQANETATAYRRQNR
jgi:hypothetical protein